MSIGQIVFSKQGRDKGFPFVVVSVKENYVCLVDGKLRKIEKPKKKKLMHIAKTLYIDESIAKSIINNEYIKNSDIRNAIEKFLRKER